MTNRFDNWSRLLKVIEHFGKSTNGFAMQIGLNRAENLYHIRKGNYGISEDLADRIIKQDPNIDRTWLLSGVGSMLKSDALQQESVPFYLDEMEESLPMIAHIQPSGTLQLPYKTNCDIVMRSFSKSMSDTISAAQDLFLKRIDVGDVVQGNEYVLITNNITQNVLWRRVRCVAGDEAKWRLVARNRDEFPDIFINKSEIREAWRVIARLTVLES